MEAHYVEEARKRRGAGYNCAQSVACAFIDRLSISEETLFQLMEGFGGGMGNYQATCGALSGAVAVLSILYGNRRPDPEKKAATYALVSKAVEAFAEHCGSLVCTEILGEESGVPLYPCDLCVEDAVRITYRLLKEES